MAKGICAPSFIRSVSRGGIYPKNLYLCTRAEKNQDISQRRNRKQSSEHQRGIRAGGRDMEGSRLTTKTRIVRALSVSSQESFQSRINLLAAKKSFGCGIGIGWDVRPVWNSEYESRSAAACHLVSDLNELVPSSSILHVRRPSARYRSIRRIEGFRRG